MRKHSNLLGIVTMLAFAGLAMTSTVTGCGGDGSVAVGGPGTGKPVCGNGKVERPETCDDGNEVNGDGCENDCTFSCDNASAATGDEKCNDKNPCNGVETCSDSHVCEPGKTATNGETCDAGKICVGGTCVEEKCGDNFTNPITEECDDGNMVDGDGCNSCKFTCLGSDPARDCSMMDPCVGKICNDMSHKCEKPILEGDACALSSICTAGVCTQIQCGDGVIQPGETCDDGNTQGGDLCLPDCTLPSQAALCGNGKRDPNEDCDDSNKTNLDGCDSTCQFEQVQRANWLELQYISGDTDCPSNALGSAIISLAQSQIQSSIDAGIKNGSISVLLKTLGLDDPTGASDPEVAVGVLSGSPVNPMSANYDGTNDLDWWYTINAQSIDANRNPKQTLAGYISGNMLYAGPGDLSLGISFAGTPANFAMSNAILLVSTGAASAPLTSGGMTPGHVSTENLDPALQAFASMGEPNNAGAGKLCGNVSAASLDAVPIPAALIAGGMLPCGQNYSASASLLDVFVSGCTVFGAVNAIKATQPDQVNPGVPAAGQGAPYTLVANTMTKIVTGCRDKANQTVDLATCLNAAAYSSFFTFATGRVIGK